MARDTKSIVKVVILLAFISGAIYLVRFSPYAEFITLENLREFVTGFGMWAPVIFIALYALGVAMFIPATLLTFVGAVTFGTFKGFVYNEIGALIGASIAFFIGRYLGRDFAKGLIGEKLKKYDDAIEKNGFATILYLRLVFFPFTPLNFGAGLTKVKFWDFFFGTLFGIIAGGFVWTFFFATLAEVVSSGNWIGLLSWQSVLAVTLFVASFFLPKVVNRFRERFISKPHS